MALVTRIFAQVIDLFVSVLVFMAAFLGVLPFLGNYIDSDAALAVIALVFIVVVIAALQYPFMTNDQTIGKAFFGLRVVSTEPGRPITVAIIVQREIFCKLMSCFFICIPLFLRKPGGHEEATRTTVERAPVQRRSAKKRIRKKAR